MRLHRLALLACLAAANPAPAQATEYYLSAAGADSNAGTSPLAPWRTLSRVNAIALRAGDRVLLQAGDTFSGTLSLDAGDTGTAAAPIAIASYGNGRAIISSGASAGIFAYNTAGVSIANLNLIGSGGAASGISFYTDLAGDVRLPFVRIDSVDVSAYGRDGIEIGAWNGQSGYSDVRVTNAALHGNARTGLLTYAQLPNTHRQVYVGHVRAFDNPGIADSPANSGSGIVLGSVDGGTIERSVAHDNGRLCASIGGPVGIWTYDSTRVTIQYNESFANRTGSSWDGGGFDLDQNVTSSVVQFNYSHDNDGAGFLLAHSAATNAHYGNAVRFNISQNDGRANSYAAIEVWGRVTGAEIYNNTIVIAAPDSGTPAAVRISNDGATDRYVSSVHFRNNIFFTFGLPLVQVTAAALPGAVDLRFEGNDYFANGAIPAIAWGTASFAGLTQWRTTGQEIVNGMPTGLSVDPRLTAAGAGASIGDADRLASLDAYRLTNGSPMADAGLDLAARFNINPGTVDFFGGQLGAGNGFDIGAHELPPFAAGGIDEVVLFASNARVAGGWRIAADPTAATGARAYYPNAGAAKLADALAAPANYFEMTFSADAGKPYRLWLRGVAEANLWSNDSVFVQFSDAIDASGQPIFRIGTSSATIVNLEEDSGAGLSGWGWQDNGWGTGVAGPPITFATSGMHTIRVQTREDGFSIDQIVLSARAYVPSAPGSLKNDATILPDPGASGLAPAEIVIHASALGAAALHGDWALATDSSAADGVTLWNPDRGAAKIVAPAAAPASYVDVPFSAQAGVQYQVWLRMRASGDSYSNDSIYIQFSGAVDAAGQPVARIGTPQGDAVVLQDYNKAPISGWGWNDRGWATLGAPYTFAQDGAQTLRIQQREDGIRIDQIVISPVKYLFTAPGAAINDATIVR